MWQWKEIQAMLWKITRLNKRKTRVFLFLKNSIKAGLWLLYFEKMVMKTKSAFIRKIYFMI